MTRRLDRGTQRVAANAAVSVSSLNSKPLASLFVPEMLELPVERLQRPPALPASCWLLRERDGAARWPSLFVLMPGRALAALGLFCFDLDRRCRSAAHRVARFLLCTAATAVTALFAPVWQGAPRRRAAPSAQPLRPSADMAASWEGTLPSARSCAVGMAQRRLRATR